MPKKHMKRKKQYQAATRENVKRGLINTPKGNWERPAKADDAMARDQFNGYRFNR